MVSFLTYVFYGKTESPEMGCFVCVYIQSVPHRL